jgi:hypothetical protein
MKFIRFILLLFVFHTISAQNSIVKFKSVKGDNFPKLSGEIWFRNPNEINSSSVFVSENGKVKNLLLSNQRVGDSISRNKAVIFLMVNPGPTKKVQFDWYRNVIGSTLSGDYIQPGDKIQIISFNQQLQGQLLYPSSFNFTDQSEILKKQLVDMHAIPYKSTCGGTRTLIWSAIDQVLDLIEKENLNIPVSIIVVSDDNSCITQQANQTPVEKAKKLGVGVYAISRDDKNRFNSIEKICLESFGSYFIAPNNDLDQAQSQIQLIMSEITKRAAGQSFDYSYTTDFENDGSSQPVTINMSGSVIDAFIQMPEKNTIQWMKSNWLILCLIFLVFGLIVFFIIKNNKDSKQKQFEIEQRAHEELRRLKNDQERVDADMAQQMADQERQLHQMRLKSQQEEESKRQIEKNKHAEEQKSFLLQEMKMRGNLPWLILVLQGQEYRYEINDPIFTIGRELSNNLNIPDSTMSRKHAVIKFKNGEYTIQDLNSSNGIIVNGQKQSEIILMHGDVIQIGQSMLTFMI